MRALVRSATELRCFGITWLVVGAALAGAALGSGAVTRLERVDATAMAVLFGFSVAAALGGLLLAKRTGPPILYARIFERAPLPPPGEPRERGRETATRTISPALTIVATLAFACPFGLVSLLLVMGEPRDEVVEGLPGQVAIVTGGWTVVCGLAALRVAAYFDRWERRTGRRVLSRPLNAGLLRHVYYAEPDR